MEPIYLDHNATTPIDNEVVSAISEALCLWGNPSSPYETGQKAKEAIDLARTQVASMLNAHPFEIVFSSGGTESNNHVIWSVLESFRTWQIANGETFALPHVVTTNVEHVAVEKPLKYWQELGKLDVTTVPVDLTTGSVTADAIIQAMRPNTVLVTVMMANNETGVLMPLEEIGEQLSKMKHQRKKANSLPLFFHTDAAQAIGKVVVDVAKLGVDFLVVVGHKFYGPRIGALFVRGLGVETELHPMMFGGGQERGYRSGTENTPMIVGLGKAADILTRRLTADNKHFIACRVGLENHLKTIFGDKVDFNFKDSPRLPNTTSACLHLDGTVSAFDVLQRCVAINASTGSACHSGVKPSAVLMASGVTEEKARQTLRLTVGRSSTLDGMRGAAEAIKEAFDSFL